MRSRSPREGRRRSSFRGGRRPRRHGVHRGLQGLRGPARAAAAGRGRARSDDGGGHALRDPDDVRGPLPAPGVPRPVGPGSERRHPPRLPRRRRGAPPRGPGHREHPREVRPGHRRRRAQHALPGDPGPGGGGAGDEREHVRESRRAGEPRHPPGARRGRRRAGDRVPRLRVARQGAPRRGGGDRGGGHGDPRPTPGPRGRDSARHRGPHRRGIDPVRLCRTARRWGTASRRRRATGERG
jgi:hypothetical protein